MGKKERSLSQGASLKNLSATETMVREMTSPGGETDANQATAPGRSQEDVFSPVVDLLMPKRHTPDGCWNKSALFQASLIHYERDRQLKPCHAREWPKPNGQEEGYSDWTPGNSSFGQERKTTASRKSSFDQEGKTTVTRKSFGQEGKTTVTRKSSFDQEGKTTATRKS